MFVNKACILIVGTLLVGVVYASEVFNDSREIETTGMMPEIVVTAPRYENQDEAWLGMIEGVVVEAERLPTVTDVTIGGMKGKNTSPNNNVFGPIDDRNIGHFLLPLTLALAMISILYVSVNAYLITEEVRNERADN